MAQQTATRRPRDPGDPGDSAARAARDARDHPALSLMARLGFAMYGVVYVVIAILAGQLAWGESAGAVSGQGALHELAQQPWGGTALVVTAAGLAALTVWELCQAVGGHTDHDGLRRLGHRLGSAGRAAVFALLAVLATQVVLGSAHGGGTDGYTARLMDLPFGSTVVIAVGAGIVALGLNSAHKGLSDRWRRQLEREASTGDTGTALELLARTGFAARGVAFGVIGGLFVWAGLTHEPSRSAGLDQALHEVRNAPYGPVLLAGIAAGLAAYGLFNVAKAWALRAR